MPGLRPAGRRRLCFKLRSGSRYLLLADLDIRTLYRDPASRYPHTDDLRACGIRLNPGEGCIAPTELLPHDGSTEDQGEPSTAAFCSIIGPGGTLPTIV